MNRRGFTLIELLVVIAIIGLLATFAVVQLTASTSKARDARRRNDMKALQKALELYYADNNTYPATPAGTWWSYCPAYAGKALTGANGYIPNLAPKYIGTLPTDPKPQIHTDLDPICSTANISCYAYRSDGASYRLIAQCDIENGPISPTDPMVDPIYPTFMLGNCSPPGSAACTW